MWLRLSTQMLVQNRTREKVIPTENILIRFIHKNNLVVDSKMAKSRMPISY